MLTHVAILCALLVTAAGWGTMGHQTTAAIAASLITPKTAGAIAKILPEGETLVSVAMWADSVKRNAAYKWSSPLHYVDTKDQACNYEYSRDCVDPATGEKGACIANAIRNFTDQLVKARRDGHLQARRALLKNKADPRVDAVKFLVHFLGDIHQPMHVAFTTDRGGNSITVNYGGKSTNLHAIWDTNIIADILNNDYSGNESAWGADLLSRVQSGGQWHHEAVQWAQCNSGQLECSGTCAKEGIHYACKNAYQCIPSGNEPCPTEVVVDGSELGTAYYKQALPVINIRIAQGGVRLAALLDHIFG